MHVRVRVRKAASLRRALRALEAAFLLAGLTCVSAFAWLQWEQRYVGGAYLREFDRMADAARLPEAVQLPDDLSSAAVLSSIALPKLPRSSDVPGSPRSAAFPVLARLRIASVGLDAPVLEGVGDRALRRGAGWIPGTARPGEAGNVGIAGHRDTVFRPLRDVRSGDRVELETLTAKRFYVVRSVYVVEPSYTSALQPTREPTLTLVTCFPFRYLGPAPRRYVVQAVAAGADARLAVQSN